MGIIILRFIDKNIFGLLNVLLSPLRYLFKKQKDIKNPKKILVIRLWALGSSILTFPMITQLKNHYGNDIDYSILATNRTLGIYNNQGYFNNSFDLFSIKDLIKLLISFKSYDIVIDTEDYFNLSTLASLWLGRINIGYSNIFTRGIAYNSGITYNDNIHASENFLALISPLNIKLNQFNYLEEYNYSDKDKIKVKSLLSDYQGNKVLCFHTGGAETNSDRFWSTENWINLINKLNNEDIYIFLSGTSFEEKYVTEIFDKIKNKKVINICNKFSLNEFAYFLKNVNVMVSNDTGPMHLSASMKTKTIGLFGPNLPERFGAYPLNKNINIYKGDYKPTINVHLGKFDEDKNNFVNDIRPEEVFEEIIKIIK